MMDASDEPSAPAPWQLGASGYILVLDLPRAELDASCFTPPSLRSARSGRFAYAMFIDYARAPVGPYRELLFIPGAFRYPDRSCFAITKIYVSSEASLASGRRNWGIPKELAQFEVDYGVSGERVDRVRVLVHGRQAVALTLRSYPIGFPLLGSVFPARTRTLRQTLDGRRFTFAPTARGPMRAARVLAADIDAELFPRFRPEQVFAAVKLPRAEMRFPQAHVERTFEP
jgi:hypothetical protein